MRNTVAVLKFSDLSGKPIALFINYPVHAVIMNGDDGVKVSIGPTPNCVAVALTG